MFYKIKEPPTQILVLCLILFFGVNAPKFQIRSLEHGKIFRESAVFDAPSCCTELGTQNTLVVYSVLVFRFQCKVYTIAGSALQEENTYWLGLTIM